MFREGSTDAGDPEFCAHRGTFECAVIHADAEGEAVATQFTDAGDPAGIGGGFLDGLDVRELVRKFLDVGGGKVGFVGDWVVVNDAGQVGGGDDSGHVGFHFPPVGGVEIRRQDHEATAAVVFCGLGDVHGFLGGKGGDARDDRGVWQGGDVGFLQREFLLE